MEVLFYPVIPGFRKNITFWEVPKFCPFAFLYECCVDGIGYGALMG